MEFFQSFFSPNLQNFDPWTSVLNSWYALKTVSIMDVVDILIVSYILYRLMKLLKDTSAARLAKGIIWLLLIFVVASFAQLTTISFILRSSLGIGVTAAIVIFQPELRRLLEQLGKGNISSLLVSVDDPDATEAAIDATVAACADMSKTKTGVLIVFERKERLGEIVATGTVIDAVPSSELLKNIFFKNSPLHDGAMIIADNRIASAACILPVSHNNSIPKSMGLRHRSALGITEVSDALAVVVSEETGNISLAHNGKITTKISGKDLERMLAQESID